MKLNANTFNTFIKNVPSTLRFFLIYGPEGGKVKNVSSKLTDYFLKSSNDNLNLITLNYKQIKDNCRILMDEMLELSLLGGRKVIIIEACAATINKELQELIKTPPKGDAIVIFLAEELKPISSLRKTCEINSHSIAIACYKDDPEQIKAFIRQYLYERKLNCSQNALNMLAYLLPSNQILIVNELEKLITYKFNDTNINENDVTACFNDSSEVIFDELCLAFALEDRKIIQKYITKMQFEDSNFVMILRILLKYFLKLTEIKTKEEQGISIEQAVNGLSPPVFFKQRENIITAAKKLSLLQIRNRLKDLLFLELMCKKGLFDPQMITFNYLTHLDNTA